MTKFKKAVLKQKIDDVTNLLEEYYKDEGSQFNCAEAIITLRLFVKEELNDIED